MDDRWKSTAGEMETCWLETGKKTFLRFSETGSCNTFLWFFDNLLFFKKERKWSSASCGWLVTLDFRLASGYGWLDNEANQHTHTSKITWRHITLWIGVKCHSTRWMSLRMCSTPFFSQVLLSELWVSQAWFEYWQPWCRIWSTVFPM